MVTGRIATFTETGLELESGERLEADVVVTATGLNLQVFGGAELSVDGEPVEPSRTMAYRAMMLSGVPNFAFTIGYTNASWTLKADLVGEYVVRLLERCVDRHPVVVPVRDPDVEEVPLMDFDAGYVQRVVHTLPRQGTRPRGRSSRTTSTTRDDPAGAPRRRGAALVVSGGNVEALPHLWTPLCRDH